MNSYVVAVLAFRFAALYAWFCALELFASGAVLVSFQTTSAWGARHQSALSGPLFALLVYVAAGLFLFFRSESLARRFTVAPEQATVDASKTQMAPCVAFAIVGLLGLLFALPTLVSQILVLLQSDQFRVPTARAEFIKEIPVLAGRLAQVALSAGVLVYSRPLAEQWMHRQGFSTARQSETT